MILCQDLITDEDFSYQNLSTISFSYAEISAPGSEVPRKLLSYQTLAIKE